jgi:hypothetical protein
MKRLLIAVALVSTTALAGCEMLGFANNNPCAVSGATEAETPKLCVIRGALTVRSAYAAMKDQLAKGVITEDEAAKIADEIDKAAAAVKAAETALMVNDSTLDEKLILLEGWVLELLRKQATIS